MLGVCILAVAIRIAIRIKWRRQLSLDDYFLLFGLASLSGAAGLAFRLTRILFLTEVLVADHPVNYVFSAQDILEFNVAMAVVSSLVILSWTATYAVKFSFLALFRQLISRLSNKITIYFWIIVGFTLLSWAYVVVEPFILCPVFGLHSSIRQFSVSISLANPHSSKMFIQPQPLSSSQYSNFCYWHHDRYYE